ncbi:hypothetical protein [Pontibacterium sp.]|uniref:hypothetical protein n=1 Tax=Pontibacterium sp. TaxID=2036026 RepID=UPI003518F8EF
MKQIPALCVVITALLALPVHAESTYEVVDNSYTVCETEAQYRQLLSWSLYGVGKKPEQGCFPAPAGAKAIIMECPESDIILCRFRLMPSDGSEPMEVWASKVMLKEIP